MYIAVCEMPRNSTPSSASAVSSGARKWSAQFACSLPGGAGTWLSGLPTCSDHEESMVAGTRRNRS